MALGWADDKPRPSIEPESVGVSGRSGMIYCVPGFDITSILDFNPPQYICPACRGLMRTYTSDYKKKPTEHSCPVCQVIYDVEIDGGDDPTWNSAWTVSTFDYFKQNGLRLDHADLLSRSCVREDDRTPS